MSFTNVYYDTKQNKIHLWEKINGEKVHNEINWVPYVFIPDENGKYKTIESMPVSKKTFNNYKSYFNFQKNTKCYENHCLPSIQFLAERYYQINEDDIITPNLQIYSIDIEVHSETGKFPRPQEADYPIVIISVNDYGNNVTHVFGIKPYEPQNNNVIYHYSDNEIDLLKDFLNWWHRNTPDVVTGWNIAPDNKTNVRGGFDLPYIINRIINLIGEEEVKKLSPVGIVKYYQNSDTEALHVTIAGINVMDYLALYKWYKTKNLENYKLETVASEELGVGKLDYSEYLHLGELYHNDWEKYVNYNITDTIRVSELEEKLGYIKLAQAVSLLCKVPMEKYNTTTQLIEGLLLVNYRRNGLCAPYFMGGKQEWFPAAHVKEPIKGLHDWNIDIDITSSYPSHIITLNMSFETLYGKIQGLKEEEIVNSVRNKKFTKPFNLKVPSNPQKDKVSNIGFLDNTVEISGEKLKKFNKILQKNQLSISPCGSCFVNNRKGVFADMEKNVFQKRKEKKNEMQEINDQISKMSDSKEKKKLKEKSERLNAYQNALKIVINGAFGITGVPYSRYFNKNIAEAITSCGRHTIKSGQKFVNEWFQQGIWYNHKEFTDILDKITDQWKYKDINTDMVCAIDTDSCGGKSEIIVNNQKILIENYFSKLPNNYVYYDDFNEFYIKKGEGNSPSVNNNLEVENNKISYIMKHKVKKKMYRISVNNKSTIVTEDHSVVVYRNNELISVKPYEIQKDDCLIEIK